MVRVCQLKRFAFEVYERLRLLNLDATFRRTVIVFS